MDDDISTLTPELQHYAALEEASTAAEAERRRLADLLDSEVMSPLNLLLAQAAAYEQALTGNPQAKMAVSVLASLGRQAMQQARDLKNNLHPALLESLGLEPALEALAAQVTRAHGLRVTLLLERQRERLPPPLELALFRAVQDMLNRAVHAARASQAVVRLERRAAALRLTLADNGLAEADTALLVASQARIEQLGGTFEIRAGQQGNFELDIRFILPAPVELTARELDVIQRLADGLTNKQIAHALDVSARTVNFHLDNIYSKLGVNSRTEAAVYALRQGWVRRPD